jgi:hypothetical protein
MTDLPTASLVRRKATIDAVDKSLPASKHKNTDTPPLHERRSGFSLASENP